MGLTTRKLALVLATALLGTTTLVMAAPSAQAEGRCTYAYPFTPRVTYLHGRTIELRANSSWECAWGRISKAAGGDLVWVDRSWDGGETWQQLGITRVYWPAISAYTEAFNDESKVMRACGKVAGYGDVRCTGWW